MNNCNSEIPLISFINIGRSLSTFEEKDQHFYDITRLKNSLICILSAPITESSGIGDTLPLLKHKIAGIPDI